MHLFTNVNMFTACFSPANNNSVRLHNCFDTKSYFAVVQVYKKF